MWINVSKTEYTFDELCLYSNFVNYLSQYIFDDDNTNLLKTRKYYGNNSMPIHIDTYYYSEHNVGIKETYKDFFSLYPNPANTYVNIKIDNNDNTKIKIFDITSKIVVVEEFNKEIRIDLKKLEKGIYIISFENNKYISSQKLIIK